MTKFRVLMCKLHTTSEFYLITIHKSVTFRLNQRVKILILNKLKF